MDKPTSAITVSVWIKLFSNGGQHVIFNTVGMAQNGHNKGNGYLLLVEKGQLKWSHKNSDGSFIFNVSTGLKVPSHMWTHIAATYDMQSKESHLFVNGKLSASGIGTGQELNQVLHFVYLNFIRIGLEDLLLDHFIKKNYLMAKLMILFYLKKL